ncbi:MAG: hypothetical protein KQH59_12080 [Desulfobulbaceae bacterium]|nr:hypothetical protein [Desulfobulbaceae bacterium]
MVDLMRFLLLLVILLTAGCNSGPETSATLPAHPTLFISESAVHNQLPPASSGERGEVANQFVSINSAVVGLQPGEHLTFQESAQPPVALEITKRAQQANGDVTLTGSAFTDDGEYRMILTSGNGGAFGRIQTPTTTYRITVQNGRTILINLSAEGNTLVPKRPDDAIVPPPKQPRQQAVEDVPTAEPSPATAAAPPAADGRTTIDLMILYTTGMTTRYPDTLATRLNHLVAEANAAYENSEVDIFLRLVHSQEVAYPDETTNSTALTALTNNTAPFDQIESLRLLHGADLVTLVRPFDYENHSGCGIAWLLGRNGSFNGDANYGYSVVSEGSEQIGSTTWYCSDLTMAHELGHNMGSHHDRANAYNEPAYPYSYGYGVSGTFGTIMSYLHPEIDRFSNPDLTCFHGDVTYPCGIDENAPDSAHNTLSLNTAAASVAAFRQARYLGDINQDGQVTVEDSLLSLIILTDQAPPDTVSSYQDINGDGKIGLAESIYILQQNRQ